MIRIFYLVTASLLLLSTLEAQDVKDSIYYSKIAAPTTKMIPVYHGKYKVFTQKIGNGQTPLLLLHGGPENTHEYFEQFPGELKQSGVTVYFYDQLGSYFSDTPDDSTIWNVDRFIEEVEEVRKGLAIDHFYLLGHSWGGMLAELYAAKYGKHLKGLILSNVPGFFAKDTKYLQGIIDSIDNAVQMRATQLPEFNNNKAQVDSIRRRLKLADSVLHKSLTRQYNKAADSVFGRTMFYHKAGAIPEPMKRTFRHLRFESLEKYHFNHFGANYKTALQQITTPTLLIGGKNDFIQPDRYNDLKKIMKKTKVRVYLSPTGAHFTMWDDPENYFNALRRFINDVEHGDFNPGN